MASRTHGFVVVLGLLVVAAGIWVFRRPIPVAPVVGIVRATEIRVAPEVGGQLAAIKVRKGDRVRAGDPVVELSALELTASVVQARAALAAAVAERDHVYAGVRAEEIATLAAEIGKARSRLAYAEQQVTRVGTLARGDNAPQQSLDQADNDVASARADVAEAEANHAAARAGPTREQRAIADAQVEAAGSALHVLEQRLEKTLLRAPTDGVVTLIVVQVGEAISAGQPVLVIDDPGKRWFSFNVREDQLRGIMVGISVDVGWPGASAPLSTAVTELLPLGPFATWQAERAVGDHDRNTLRLRLEPRSDSNGLDPGMTVWLNR
jgi:HlyD family secretion protein